MSQKHYIELEKPIADLQEKIASLKNYSGDENVNLDSNISDLEHKITDLRKNIFSKLDAWGVQQFARHPERPYTLDYIKLIFTDFEEIAGDRCYGNDHAMVAGIARLEGRPVVVIGTQKGRTTNEKVKYNFGMPSPEGYRKALRALQLAERFKMPVITFIDTPGAYPGIGAEERGQSEAIAVNLREFSNAKTPIVVNIIGEGGSGGALAIGVGDKVNMLQYSTYSVISPEGCASILWKSADKANLAAEALCLTAPKIQNLGLVDNIVPEPIGGAHINYVEVAQSLKERILDDLFELDQLSAEELLERRYNRILDYGY